MAKEEEFEAIRLSIASPEEIKKWSYGEVTKPETINYRTQKPEKDGLFDERIFGPTKDYECYCGKYKKVRYKGVICDKCGVEVTRSSVRRERMGHINLTVPVTHIWYVRGVPSKIGLVLDLSVKDLEKVIYFGSYIILEVNEDIRQKALENLEKEYLKMKSQFKAGAKIELDKIKIKALPAKKLSKKHLAREDLDAIYLNAKNELKNLRPKQIISEKNYLDLSLKYGQLVKVGIGAEAIYELLKAVDLDKEIKLLEEKLAKRTEAESKKDIRRLKVFNEFKQANLRPEWMVLTVLPVIPPDLRPMVQLDGGRFAASDLNDLYRRVINRNNRLKKLYEQKAPEVICRNEKRMLQEAVDALIDNSARRDKSVVTTAGRRKLKSLSDMLRGKQGRFRQNLLGKRVDYSGRSVIVVGPQLKLNQVGLPKEMALELFKPFVISKLISLGFAHNVKNASRLLEKQTDEVWDILENIIKDHLVLLNRAPTLHRLGVQAFKPVLVEGKAIQIHPLVCPAYNADFDGDQMAVYIPLSKQAQFEASSMMYSIHNLLKPASGEPIIAPSSDIVFGIYYLTKIQPNAKGENKSFANCDEAVLAYENGVISLRAKIKVRIDEELVETTVGRIKFNEILPSEMRFFNEEVGKKTLRSLIAECFFKYGAKKTVKLLDKIKTTGFHYATQSGATFAISDLEEPPQKKELIAESQKTVLEIDKQYDRGLITSFEKYLKTVELWTQVKDEVKRTMLENFSTENSLYMMITSGSRGTPDQLIQIVGMKGLVANPAGEIIEIPILASYKQGLNEFEYFISSHGARKGKSDTALRTADAGYLTRRLIDVAQDTIVTQEDCGTSEGMVITREESEESSQPFKAKILGRIAAKPIIDPKTKEVIVEKDEEIDELKIEKIEKAEIQEVYVRTVLACQSKWGVCQKCYGRDLATGKIVDLGTAVGIIAAQAIGEPGTQLTMRTFHIGGIAGEDITQGLPRVEELFEARNPRVAAVVSEIDGQVSISHRKDFRVITIKSKEKKQEVYKLTKGYKVIVNDGEKVKAKQPLAKCLNKPDLKAIYDGLIKLDKDKIILISKEFKTYEYHIPKSIALKVSNGDLVTRGTPLTEGAWNLNQMLRIAGREKVAKYILNEIQDIYSSQGQTINDKHLELIVRQMFSKVRVKNPGDSQYLPNQMIDRLSAIKENLKLKSKKKNPIIYEDIILGVTKVALNTESFLSAASFQETTRTLIEAATKGKIDPLRGLKENVIIGRLIPAGTGFEKSRVYSEMQKYLKG